MNLNLHPIPLYKVRFLFVLPVLIMQGQEGFGNSERQRLAARQQNIMEDICLKKSLHTGRAKPERRTAQRVPVNSNKQIDTIWIVRYNMCIMRVQRRNGMFTHEIVKSFNQLEMDVYNYVVQNEDKVIHMKVRELADAVHVSTTTVLRFCKKAGCEGYSEFRLKLKQEMADQEKTRLDMDIEVLNDFFNRTQARAFQENMKAAVDILKKSASIIFVGVGSSAIMGQYGARYFNNVGWLSFAIGDPFTPVLRGKNENTVVVALSVSGETEQTILLAEQLKRRGCPLIAITNKSNCTIAKMGDCTINYYLPVYRSHRDFDLTSQIAVVFILEALGRQLRRLKNSSQDILDDM